MTASLNKKVLSVKQLLSLDNLVIPDYQRPYKWTLKNVTELFQDVVTQQDKSAYRLGTIVFHQHAPKDKIQLDIVDGQQRTLTLLLAVWAIINARLKGLERQNLKDKLNEIKPVLQQFMQRQNFASEESQYNLKQNYQELTRLVARPEFTEAHIDFLLDKCQVVVFVLDDISEAFQFFDSQNARGRDLQPHDLLKAFHLREFSDYENELKAETVKHWESLDSDDLAELFAIYLYRIRQWAKGRSARYFGKNQVGLFKGVNLDKVGYYPYVETLRITHHFVDEYNSQYQRKIDGQKQVFPFHLDQMIINGRRFFELAEHYQQQVAEIKAKEYEDKAEQLQIMIKGHPLNEQASNIICTLNSNEKYPNRTRTGDRYIRSIFDCALIFYIDKFGVDRLSLAIEKIFIWAYSCRIKQQVVQLATMDNYVLENNLFTLIKEATHPNDVFTFELENIKASENKNNRRSGNADNDPLVKLFRDMKYYE
ncbi:DUF262 domain-containing protein [Parahaliea sp. F7430]|uniref:DUF262 domain-containing protein n=1 Tax=Sediminihaliea albiluteola TaxID=2758564 RepID=A0A7W2YHS9_9GAMM|nr:DUF262 domain-containing protein [Sediminihaliea albiluteola]MBA6411756.1 DUF262 domain-containing protein [Sediminihaliea albiluteola]